MVDRTLKGISEKELMLSIKLVVDDLKQEAHDKKLVDIQSGILLKSVQECLGSIKIQIERIKTEQTGFIEARKDRSLNCDKVHSDHEQRLRKIPGDIRCTQNEHKVADLEAKVITMAPLKRVEAVEIKVDGFTPLLYKLIGGVAVVAFIIPPIVSVISTFIFKYLKGE